MSTPTSPAKAGRSKDAKANGSNTRQAAATETKSVASVSARPTDQDIARRAYEIYEREGRQEGRELQNWLMAEAELSGAKGH